VYIADGYMNKRAIVFDRRTGRVKRPGSLWKPSKGADTGEIITGAQPDPQFRNPVHSCTFHGMGLVYAVPLSSIRMQVFHKAGKNSLRSSCELNRVWVPCGSSRFRPMRSRSFFGGRREQTFILTCNGKDGAVGGQDRTNGRKRGQFHWIRSDPRPIRGELYTGEGLGRGPRIVLLRPARSLRNEQMSEPFDLRMN